MTAPPPGPRHDEIEVSLFGPGFGESVVVHLGAGAWIIVDSCVDKALPDPTPLHYLKSIGVDVSTAVSHVVASHWHDDHVRGISQILSQCRAAKFVCSMAMVTKNFQMLGELYSSSGKDEFLGVDEFARVHKIIDAQARKVTRTGPNRRLIFRPGAVTGLAFDVQLYSLSPSDDAANASIRELATTLSAKSPVQKLAKLYPNDFSIVLQLIAGQDSILLGSDMETCARYGWTAILADAQKPQEKSHTFKVSHHGSASGHDAKVWDQMLKPEPFAFLTPFVSGGTRLPTKDDVTRIMRLTRKGYITADPTLDPKRRYAPSVLRTIKESNYKIVPLTTCQGQIRFRITPGKALPDEPDVFNGARKL